jgi:MFS family permease
MLRIGPHASYLFDVLPAVVVMGLGMTALVAPLTSTVLSSVESRHAGAASGVNNAVARTGGLLAVAALPLVVGLSGKAYDDPAAFNHGFRIAVVVSAAPLAVAALISALFVRRTGATAPVEAAPARPAPIVGAPAEPAPGPAEPAPVGRSPEWQVSCNLCFPPPSASPAVGAGPDRPAA